MSASASESLSSRDEQPIGFSILRLSKLDFVSEIPIKLNLKEDMSDGEPLLLSKEERTHLVAEEGFSGRIHAGHASDLAGMKGYLQLPAHFGQIHLGESVMCYVTACNNCGYTMSSVEIIVEIVTNRARTVLFENRESPIPEMKSDDRKDFLVRYDVKDVGEHQLKCMASFTSPRQERTVLPPQAVSFVAMAPLSIRTKVRYMGESCLLETCLECLKTDEPLMLDYVRFEPVNRYTATLVDSQQDDIQQGPLKDYINSQAMKVMGGHHCTRNFLFRLDPVMKGLSLADLELQTLGKLEIKWRTRFGESGRLQTQQIQAQRPDSGTPTEVIGRIVSLTPQPATVYHPFEMVVRLENYTEDTIGPITIALPDGEASENSAIQMSGSEKIRLRELPGGESRDVHVSLVSLQSGIQTINNLKLFDESTKGVVGFVQSREIFVTPYTIQN